jgi:hypothetical protein
MRTMLTVLTQYYEEWGDRRARGMFPTRERAGTYESRVWRLAAQTIWMLDGMRAAARPLQLAIFKPVARHFWDRARDALIDSPGATTFTREQLRGDSRVVVE